MRCFVAFLKIELRSIGLYRADFLLKLLYGLIAMYGVRCLWGTLYAQNPAMVGRPLPSMITYAMLAAALDIIFYPPALSTVPQNYIAQQVRVGRIDTDLLRPMGLQRQLFSRNAANAVFGALCLVLPAWFIAVLLLGMQLPPSITSGVCFLFSGALGFVILFSLNFLLGMLCFVTVNIRQITMTYSGILTLLSGKLIPNWMYPGWMQAVISVLPFRCIFEIPLNIYTGAVTSLGALQGLLLQCAWAASLLVLGRLMWGCVHRHLAVQGG